MVGKGCDFLSPETKNELILDLQSCKRLLEFKAIYWVIKEDRKEVNDATFSSFLQELTQFHLLISGDGSQLWFLECDGHLALWWVHKKFVNMLHSGFQAKLVCWVLQRYLDSHNEIFALIQDCTQTNKPRLSARHLPSEVYKHFHCLEYVP